MTETLTMFDADQNDQFPAGADAYAGYVDGALGDQPNYAWIVREFPAAHHLSIALSPDHDADALDVETGAARPQDIPGWFARQRQRGVQRPCIYASVSTMEAYVVPLMRASSILRASVRLWSAHYLAGEHICGPGTCKLVSIGMDGTQWDDAALGSSLDQSLLLPDFFGTPPAQWTEFDMSKLPILRQGDTDKAGSFFSVVRMQDLVRRAGTLNSLADAAAVSSDGDFGPVTDGGVRSVQEHYRIAVDGVCGSDTWSVLLTGSPA